MSKIKTELLNATEITPKRGTSAQDLLRQLVAAVTELNDAEWDALSDEAQDWFNAAADAANAKADTLPDFPDAEAEEEPKTSSRRGRASADKEETKTTGTKEVKEPKLKQAIKLVTKRGKEVSGTVVEIDDEIIVLKMGNGDEEEFARDRVASMHGLEEAADDDVADPIKVGGMVKVVTKRGKEISGKLVEMDDEVIVLDVDGAEQEFARDRVESVSPVGAAKEEAKTSRRGGRASADKEEAKTEKPKRASNEGVSVGQRIKELMLDDLEATPEEIGKILTKEGIEFRENTLKMNFSEARKFLELLKARKMLKA